MDTTTWDLWWRYNAEPYLTIRRSFAPSTPGTSDSGVGLGRTPKGVHTEILRTLAVPELLAVLEEESDVEVISATLLALARIGQDVAGDEVRLSAVITPYLAEKNRDLSEAAAIALGALGEDRAALTLGGLLRDDEAGHRACGRSEVPVRIRAFAAYGLGLTGARTANLEVRRFIAHVLHGELRDPKQRRDVGVACAIAAGLVRLPLGEGASSSASRETQLEFLADVLENEAHHDLVRAHAVTSLGRLLEGVGGEVRELHAQRLLKLSSRFSKVDRSIQQSAVLALGGIADADDDAFDRATRTELMRVFAKGDQQCRRFAAIALSQVASRAGQGDKPFAGTQEVRSFLMSQLARGKSTMRPWTALALGVMGRGLRDAGQPLSRDASRALHAEMKGVANPERVGAYAIALGLRGDGTAQEALAKGMGRFDMDRTRGWFSIALGLSGAGEAVDGLHQVILESDHRGQLMHDAALALGLVHDPDVLGVLDGTVREAPCTHVSSNASRPLGRVGDSGTVDTLVQVIGDTSRDRRARRDAIAALGVLGEKEELPWNSKIAQGLNYLANPLSLTGGEVPGILQGL